MEANTYTFLFTDIEGSTRYWEQQPEAMRTALEKHNTILRQAIESRKGWIFRTAGDAFFASFRSAPAALEAAVEAQKNLYLETWDLESPLKVRMALHTGEAEEQDGDYVGSSLNRIGRLISVSNGGQILLTQAVQELVRDNLAQGISLLSLGRHRFRDLIYPEHIYQVVIEGMPVDFPPLKSLESIPNNLPIQLTRFIGRENLLTEAADMLANTRLLTVTGPGGTGKTRLALQLAADQLDVFPDGIWLVELAPITDPALLPQSVAGVLSIREHPHQSMLESIRDAVRGKQLLILLDNCEHLIEACAKFSAELLRASSGVKILASSREVLSIPGETVLRVPPLSLPVSSETVSPEELLQSEAVQLFVERAKAVQPQFEITNQNAAAISQICYHLDGIPLAIELAAARVRLLQPEQIAARLNNLFRLLTSGSRAALPRQQTIKAMIDWSYDLLSETERTLLRRLSIFSGGWTLEAAEAIWDEMENNNNQPFLMTEEVLDLLSQLVNKSLVLVDNQDQETRYRLLETIRQYAENKLVEAGEAVKGRDKHLLYFTQLSREANAGLNGEQQFEWLNRLEMDHDNLRSALDWGLQNNLLSSLEMGANLAIFWSGRGYSSEGRRWLQAGLDKLESSGEVKEDDQTLKIQARALYAYGLMAIIQGDNAAAREKLEQCVQIQRQIGELQDMVFSITQLSLANLFLGDIDQSQALAEEGETLGRQLQEPLGLALALSILAQIAMRKENGYQGALEKINESARLLRKHGNRWFSALSLMGLGIIAYLAQDFPTALEHFTESKNIFQQTGDLHFTNVVNSYLADVARQKGEIEEAEKLYKETLKMWLRIGHRGGLSRCLECLAFIALLRAFEEAEANLDERVEWAGKLLGAAENIRETSRMGMTIDEQMDYYSQIYALRAKIAQNPALEAVFDKAWKLGRVKDEEEVLALVL